MDDFRVSLFLETPISRFQTSEKITPPIALSFFRPPGGSISSSSGAGDLAENTRSDATYQRSKTKKNFRTFLFKWFIHETTPFLKPFLDVFYHKDSPAAVEMQSGRRSSKVLGSWLLESAKVMVNYVWNRAKTPWFIEDKHSTKMYLNDLKSTLPETNSSHLKISHSQRKRLYSNHPFSGAMLVWGRVYELCTTIQQIAGHTMYDSTPKVSRTYWTYHSKHAFLRVVCFCLDFLKPLLDVTRNIQQLFWTISVSFLLSTFWVISKFADWKWKSLPL